MILISSKNRGKYLETVIEASNRQYKQKGLAQIDKIATPMKVQSRGGQVTRARYAEKSTVDFVGTVKGGQSIAFDTKETKVPNLPFYNIHQHQIEYLTRTHELGGQAFLLVLFKKENELYRLEISELNELKRILTRKSIPLKWFRENKRPITSSNGIAYNYLEAK